jgi:hypothetical protein
MIAVENIDTGEVQLVASLDGYPSPPWAVLDPAPAWPWRDEVRARINRARDEAQEGGADTVIGRLDTSPKSREFLHGKVTEALITQLAGGSYTTNFTRADNTTDSFTGAQIIQAGVDVAAWVDAVHARALVLKGRIDAAETLAELEAITWTLEDPE